MVETACYMWYWQDILNTSKRLMQKGLQLVSATALLKARTWTLMLFFFLVTLLYFTENLSWCSRCLLVGVVLKVLYSECFFLDSVIENCAFYLSCLIVSVNGTLHLRHKYYWMDSSRYFTSDLSNNLQCAKIHFKKGSDNDHQFSIKTICFRQQFFFSFLVCIFW